MKENLKIDFLHREEIDDKRWNTSIDDAFNGNIYAYSWYLDVVSPNWGALVTPDYNYLFPLPIKRKYGINYIIQPLFCQQLGLFSSKLISPEIIDKFIESIPSKFRYVDINLNIHNKTNKYAKQTSRRKTYMLDLLNYNEQVFKNYNHNTKRNIFKAIANEFSLTTMLNPNDFLKSYKQYGYMVNSKKDIAVIEKLIETLIIHNKATIAGVVDNNNQVGAVALFTESHNTIHYLLGAAEPNYKKKGAMFYLMDGIIRNHSGMDKVLDFEGSMILSIARFFSGFGARPCIYLNYKRSTLPASKAIVNIKRKLKLL
ncbi:MAG: hypothetical protein AB1777_00120 [Bacteroidota bacterium]